MNGRRSHAAILLAAAAAVLLPAAPSTAEKPPHMSYPSKLLSLDTGYILGSGANVKIGLGESGFGIADRVQLTTNTILDAVALANIQVKAGILRDARRVPAVSVLIGYYDFLASDLVIDGLMEEVLEEEDISISSSLEVFAASVTVSKAVSGSLRLHIGYQYRHLDGYVDSDDTVWLEDSEGDSLGVDTDVEGEADHRSLVGAVDFDALDHLKLILEMGIDFTYGKFRGGAGIRAGIGTSFAFQAGVMWPGAEIEDVDVPVIPHISLFWRF